MKLKRAPLSITPASVAKHKHVAGTSPFLWDQGDGCVKGFYLRVTPSGGKQFGIQYTLAGKQRRFSLGPVEDWKSVDEARDEARLLLDRVKKEEISPTVGRDGTMQAVWDHYIEGLKTGRVRRKLKNVPAAEKTIKDAIDCWENHLAPALGRMKPADVKLSVIDDVHARISKQRKVKREGRGSRRLGGPVTANRCMTYLAAAWRASSAYGLTTKLPDPFVGFTRNHEAPEQTFLEKEQGGAFFAALAKEDEPVRTYWHLSLLTGARGLELRSLTWDDIDLATGKMTFARTKNRTAHVLVLPTEALGLMRNLRQLFPDSDKPFDFSYPKASWKRILARAGIENVKPHGLRRSFGQWQAEANVSTLRIASALNHKSDVTAKTYARLAGGNAATTSLLKAQEELMATIAAGHLGAQP